MRVLDVHWGEALLAPTRILCQSTQEHQSSGCDSQSLQPYYRRRIL